MYTDYFGLSDEPFTHRSTLDMFATCPPLAGALRGLKRSVSADRGLIVLAAPSGSGKTAVLRRFAAGFVSDRKQLCAFSPDWLNDAERLAALETALSRSHWAHVGFDDTELLRIRHFFKGRIGNVRKVLLLVDNAQHLDDVALPRVLALAALNVAGRQPCRLLLAGSGELATRIDAALGVRPALARAIDRVDVALPLLSAADSVRYLQTRLDRCRRPDSPLQIDAAALARIAAIACGVLRPLHRLADASLALAYRRATTTVSAALVADAAREQQLFAAPARPATPTAAAAPADIRPAPVAPARRWPLAAAAALASVALGGALAVYQLTGGDTPEPAAAAPDELLIVQTADLDSSSGASAVASGEPEAPEAAARARTAAAAPGVTEPLKTPPPFAPRPDTLPPRLAEPSALPSLDAALLAAASPPRLPTAPVADDGGDNGARTGAVRLQTPLPDMFYNHPLTGTRTAAPAARRPDAATASRPPVTPPALKPPPRAIAAVPDRDATADGLPDELPDRRPHGGAAEPLTPPAVARFSPRASGDAAEADAEAQPQTEPHPDPLTLRLQHQLNALGYKTGPIDGYWGRRTATAVANFQANAGLQINPRMSRRLLLQQIDRAIDQRR